MYYQLLALPCVVNSCLLLRVAPPLVPHGSPTLSTCCQPIRQPVKREFCGSKKKAPPVVRAARYWQDLPTPSR